MKSLLFLLVVLPLISFAHQNLLISVRMGDPGFSGPEHVTSYQTESRSMQKRIQQIVVGDGQTAYVTTTHAFPQATWSGGFGNYGTYGGVEISDRELVSGFWVTPTVLKNHIKLEITQKRSDPDPRGGGQYNAQEVSSTLYVPLNRWVNMGGSEDQVLPASDTSRTYSTRKYQEVDQEIYIKVNSLYANYTP